MARTRAQAGPRRSPRIKRNQERTQAQSNIVRERTSQQHRQRSLTQRPTLEFNTTPPPPLVPPSPNAELARRTQISRDFYQSLMDRHQLPETRTNSPPRLAQVTFLGGNRPMEELQLRISGRIRSTDQSEPTNGVTRVSTPSQTTPLRGLARRSTLPSRRSTGTSQTQNRQPGFLFAHPRSRVQYRNISLSVVPPENDDENLEAPRFDPEELQRLFWRDIFSLDIWNLESRSVGLTNEQFDEIETKTFKSTRSSRHESCHVCLLDFENAQVLKRLPRCGHEFHPQCLKPWLEKHTTCPVCRERATKE